VTLVLRLVEDNRQFAKIEVSDAPTACPDSNNAMPLRGTASGRPNVNPLTRLKVEHPDEFSHAVKRKLSSSSRTGQACDCCKVRSNAPSCTKRLLIPSDTKTSTAGPQNPMRCTAWRLLVLSGNRYSMHDNGSTYWAHHVSGFCRGTRTTESGPQGTN
jgi:hypothetical protein